MSRKNSSIVVVCMIFLVGCASFHKSKTLKSDASAESSKTVKPQEIGRTVKSSDGSVTGQIIGTPAPESKFSKLQIGMSLEQVKALIGQPNSTDSRITGKQFQPFYFGGDTERTEAFYNGEGRLTFSNIHPDTAADTLIKILVSPDAAGNN